MTEQNPMKRDVFITIVNTPPPFKSEFVRSFSHVLRLIK